MGLERHIIECACHHSYLQNKTFGVIETGEAVYISEMGIARFPLDRMPYYTRRSFRIIAQCVRFTQCCNFAIISTPWVQPRETSSTTFTSINMVILLLEGWYHYYLLSSDDDDYFSSSFGIRTRDRLSDLLFWLTEEKRPLYWSMFEKKQTKDKKKAIGAMTKKTKDIARKNLLRTLEMEYEAWERE